MRAVGDLIARDVAAMTRALAHRGPDDEGLLFWRRGSPTVCAATEQTTAPLRSDLPDAAAYYDTPWQIALGHRRFSILDVTPRGHQPFGDPEGRASLVFNGEIYNFVELRAELERLGVVFRTHSDTEVLLQAYLEWGEAMLPRLNGMWAFALLDYRTGRVLLSRDRAGEKSLFYTRVGDRFYFASEIKALFAVPEIRARRRPHDELVQDYLFLGLRDHTHESMFDGIVNLPPATIAWLDVRGEVRPQSYWQLPAARRAEHEIGYEEAQRHLLSLLADSVGIRLRADVPLAAELSGGMDSTSMVALAAKRLREEEGPHRLRTFTIRYGDPKFDESAYAAKTAEMAGADFNPLLPKSADYWTAAETMMSTMEQPYESPNLIGCLSMWTIMKGLGIRVVLNGGAGDELLAGYIHSHLLPFLRELLLSGRWRASLNEALAWRGTEYVRGVFVRHYVLHQMAGPLRRSYVRRIFDLPEFAALVTPPGGIDRMVREAELQKLGGLSDVLIRNVTTAPIPMYVVQSDKLAMSVPVEVRYPYLDHRLMEFGFQLPISYLIRGGRSKAVLRDAARGLIPDEVISRREKMGFPVPLRQWMREGLPSFRAQFGNDPRSGRFINAAAAVGTTDRISEAMLWRIHQVELWMKVFDLE